MELDKSIDHFLGLVDKFDLLFERIYHLQYDNIGELIPGVEGLYTRYSEIDNVFNRIVDTVKSNNIDGGDSNWGDALEEVTTEYMRVTDVRESLYKIIKGF